jgi:3-deoxy-D-arabino-heptulosonate 7-phosphate (DAHP) synthase
MRGLSIGNGNTYIAIDSFNAGAFYNSSSGYYASSNQIVSTTGNRHARMVQRNGATIPRYAVNGGTITNMETADGVISSTTHINVGVGGGGFATNFFTTGHIAEIIAYTSYLSDSQIRQVEGYLAWKWRLQNSLPSAHPYKKISPI